MPRKATNSRLYAYKALDFIPISWDIFAYNSFGELESGRTYSHKRWCDTCITSGLTLWIQRTPQDSALGHGYPKASLCRFEDCEHINVINAGDIRVAFDELITCLSNLNPKHNAGYVHLCCLEKKADFSMLCKDPDFKPEDGALPLERVQENPMMMRDRTELDYVQRFIDFCNANCCALRSGWVSRKALPFSNGSKGVSNDMTNTRRRRIMQETLSKQGGNLSHAPERRRQRWTRRREPEERRRIVKGVMSADGN